MKKLMIGTCLLLLSFSTMALPEETEKACVDCMVEGDAVCLELAENLARAWGSMTGFGKVFTRAPYIQTHQGSLNGVFPLIVVDVILVDGITNKTAHAKVFLNSTCEAQGVTY